MSTFTGKTVNEAIQSGLKYLNIDQNDANINIIQTGRKGFLGIGKRDAKVEITRQESSKTQSKNYQYKDASDKQASVDQAVYEKQPTTKKQDNQSTLKSNHSNESYVQNDLSNSNHSNDKRQNNHSKSNYSRTLSSKQKKEVAADKLVNYLSKIVEELGINATIHSKFMNNKKIKLNFDTDKEGLLIGKHGLTINALQSLSQIYLDHLGFYHLYAELDTANYRQRRMDVLEKLSEKTAREAVATGQPVYLDPMPSFERKKIHRTLESSNHVMTYSAGREPYRAVVVAPR